MRIGLVAALGAAVMLSGCQTTKQVFVRTDGQVARNDPALSAQFDVDKAICEGEAQKAGLSGSQICLGDDCLWQSIARQRNQSGVVKGCMASKGYLLVPEEEAPAKAAQFRALHAANQTPAAKPVSVKR